MEMKTAVFMTEKTIVSVMPTFVLCCLTCFIQIWPSCLDNAGAICGGLKP